MKTLIMLIALFWLPLVSPQQKFQFSNNSKVSVAGTSTLHDWSMDSRSISGEADMELSADNKILSIKAVKLEIPVQSLKSGKDGMDKNAYEALKASKHPTILFQLKDFEEITTSGGASVMEVRGNLSIAGKTRPESILVKYRTDKNGNLYLSGSKDIEMTDYGVTPPEVMFGTVKTGNSITIKFDLYLQQGQLL